SVLLLLGLSDVKPPESRDTETVRRIAAELDKLEPEEARFLAAFAYVRARVANADYEVSEDEIREMERLVRKLSELGEAQAALVVQIAKTQAVTLGATENYVVTRQFREVSTREQRLSLLRCLFAVAAADESISEAENTEITLIATELGLTQPEIVAARSVYRDKLAVLKGFPRG
ncbi:MAG: TerB family tellurite resistance protein, partial [Myxococcales bacterium]|nr:TerB family tellurite resistance protein [Myxococcales bacterium]